MRSIDVLIRRLENGEDIELPSYESIYSSGADLRAAVRSKVEIAPNSVVLVPCGFSIAIPYGYEGQVRSRSGLALKNSIFILNSPGTIDSDYRGEVKLIVANFSNTPFVVERGMRLAQLVICPVCKANFICSSTLPETERNTGGFGSTGI